MNDSKALTVITHYFLPRIYLSIFLILNIGLSIAITPLLAEANITKTPEAGQTDNTHIQELFESTQKIKTCKGSFVQTKHLDVFDENLESKGRFILSTPGKIEWEYLSPLQSYISIDGENLTQKQGQKSQTKSLKTDPVSREIYRQMMNLMTGQMKKLNKDYLISIVPKQKSTVQLTPRTEAMKKYIMGITIEFNPKIKYVSSIRFTEPGGDWTHIAFSDVTVESPL
ncbi:MAG: outer membrane lipoprotein carrier protein LolA [Planctomycetes bacterium]|nr:outer membrane lipoprotein carrier protein LolA [Planctomycetota bacterium]